MPRQRLLLAAVLILASELMFTSMGAAIKMIGVRLPNEVVVFFRNLFGLTVLLPWLWCHGSRVLETCEWRLHLLRTLAGLASMYCFFYAVAHLPLANAVVLTLTAPLYIPFIASLWLQEAVPSRVWGAVAVGFAGVAIMCRPTLGGVVYATLVSLAGAACAAVAHVSIRRLAWTEPATRTVLYFSLIATPVSAVPLVWQWQTPMPEIWAWLALAGACATAGQLLLARALAFAPAAQIGAVAYVGVLFAAIYGWLLWGEGLDAFALIGAALICLAGILTGSSSR